MTHAPGHSVSVRVPEKSRGDEAATQPAWTVAARRAPNADPAPCRTIPEALEAAPAGGPFITMWNSESAIRTVTFGDFRIMVSGQVDFLREHEVGPGDTVILIMPQGISLMAVFVAALYLGAIPAILAYPNFKTDPVKYREGLSGVSANLNARLIVVDEMFPTELKACIRIKNSFTIAQHTANAVPRETRERVISLDPHQIAFIQHSAGTTGLQKGVALSHAAVIRQISHLASAIRLSSEDRIYSWLPLYHDMGLIACFMLPLVCHLHVVMQSPADWVLHPGSMLQLISDYRCTLAWIPNFTLQFVARSVRPEDRGQYDLSSLRMLINCSEPVRAASIDEFAAAYRASGLRQNALQSCYAMAETVFAVTQSGCNGRPDPERVWVDSDVLRKDHLVNGLAPNAPGATCFVSSGACLPGSRVHILSENGERLAAGRVGEIAIQSDTMLEGYFNRPDMTAKAIQEGWYLSGDLGFELDGELYVIGRKKDLIIVGGENIYPQDVEEIICQHASIHDGRAVAMGVFNSNLGTQEIVVVAEVNRVEDLANSIAIECELKASVKSELAVAARAIYLKPPKWIVKSTAGKAARSTTRNKLLSEHPELRADVQGVVDP